MKITYQLTQKEVLEALRKNNRGTKLNLIAGIFCMTMAIGGLATDPKHPVGAIVPIVAGLFLIFTVRLQARGLVRKSMLCDETVVDFSDSGMTASNSVAKTEFAWPAFNRYAESTNLFLLYQSQAGFRIFPKRAFAPGEADAFRSLLDRHMGDASKAHDKKARMKTWIWVSIFAVAAMLLVITILMIRRRDADVEGGLTQTELLGYKCYSSVV